MKRLNENLPTNGEPQNSIPERICVGGGGNLGFPQGFWADWLPKNLVFKGLDGCTDAKTAGQLSSQAAKLKLSRHCETLSSPLEGEDSGCVPSPGTREDISCAKRTEKNLFPYSPIHLLPSKRVAFTLAEVLITLGIIGVVSAVTMPTLVNNHKRQVYVTQLHKVYNELSQAAEAQIAARNAVSLSEAGINSDATMKTFLKNQFKVTKDCTGTPSNCLASSYTNLNGGSVTSFSDTSAPCLTLASGAVICADYTKPQKKTSSGTLTASGSSAVAVAANTTYNYNMIAHLVVDTNGKSKPNIVGRDLFVMGLFNDGSITYQNAPLQLLSNKCTFGTVCEAIEPKTNLQLCQGTTSVAAESDAVYCFEQIIKNGWKMEY